MAYRVWRRESRKNEVENARVEQQAEMLSHIQRVEDFIWPMNGDDWLEKSNLFTDSPYVYQQFNDFRELIKRWQSSIALPIDQIVLILAQDLLTDPRELAVAHKLAVLLGTYQKAHPDWTLMQLTDELVVIARNERRFLGFSDGDYSFEPEIHKGKVVLSTMHKSKGLEWDRVYLMSVNNYDFPSGTASDSYIAERWFIRGSLNLQAEALAQLQALTSLDKNTTYREGDASIESRLDYARERLRLLYVGITRAKKELIITWNSGRHGDAKPAVALIELFSYQEKIGGVSHKLA
jgi:DNA helicase-2/ATP-dependent DNA helicase PcrA